MAASSPPLDASAQDPAAAVLLAVTDSVAVVTINRLAAHNSISPEVAVRLARVWRTIKADDSIRVAILTGAGSSAFCAGADLKRLITLVNRVREPEDEWDRLYLQDSDTFSVAFLREFQLGKPLIAAINGYAVAGGMELVQASDIRVSVSTARFGLQEPKWGLFPMGGSTVRLPRQIPRAIAMEILLTGSLYSAQRMEQVGFLNYVVSADQLMPAAMKIAKTIAANGPVAIQAILASVKACCGVPELEALAKELAIAQPVFQHPDAVEGPLAFAQKRPPVWQSKL